MLISLLRLQKIGAKHWKSRIETIEVASMVGESCEPLTFKIKAESPYEYVRTESKRHISEPYFHY